MTSVPDKRAIGNERARNESLVLPGLIDCHVHFREPGLTHKEDFETGMRAALAGGVTTVCDMPNTDPPTCTLAALEEKIQRAQRLQDSRFQVSGFRFDIRFFFGITKREHLAELEKVMRSGELRKYVPGVKLYLGQSTGDQMVDPSIVQDVFRLCTDLDLPLVCHCEDEEMIRQNERGIRYQVSGIKAHSDIRSIAAAVKAVERVIGLARKFGTHLHVAHVSSAQELRLIRQAKRSGIRITCEVAPYHLFLNTDDYAVLGTLAKVNPPLRTKEHNAALFEGLLDGTIDCIASDHAPHTLEEKLGRHAERRPATYFDRLSMTSRDEVEAPLDAPSGVPGTETMLPLLLSCVFGEGPIDAEGRKRFQVSGSRFQVSDIVRLLFENPNRIFRLGRSKESGSQITVDPAKEWVIHGKELHSKCKWTPYEGWTVRGGVVR